MRLIYFLATIFCCLFAAVAGQDQKYCDPALCNGQVNVHVACPGVAASSCPADAKLVDMSLFRDNILRFHNEGRNRVAQGLLGLPQAKRLTEITWDDELAYIAAMNVKTCNFYHDSCRNTLRFPYAGQNIAWSSGFANDTASIQYALNGWWNEYTSATAQDIASYKTSTAVIGHFTVMVNQKSIKVGCAGITYNKSQRLFTCNYSFTNGYGTYVYQAGTTGSACTSARSTLYPALCNATEPIDPKQFW